MLSHSCTPSSHSSRLTATDVIKRQKKQKTHILLVMAAFMDKSTDVRKRPTHSYLFYSRQKTKDGKEDITVNKYLRFPLNN